MSEPRTMREYLVAIIDVMSCAQANHTGEYCEYLSCDRCTAAQDAEDALTYLDSTHHALNEPRVGGYFEDDSGARYRLVADPVRPKPPIRT